MNEKHEAVAALLRQQRYQEAERKALKLLAANRFDAQGWVLLGEALLHQSCGLSARRCFRRALLLDPLAAWAEAAERAVGRAPEGEERPEVERLLRVPRTTVTAVVIAKNEAATIGRCLASLRGAVDRVLFFDNGSDDGTKEIAERFPDVEVFDLAWNGSFAELRNEALKRVDTDWVLWLDGDEWLHEEDREAVKEAAGCCLLPDKPVVLHVWRLNAVNGRVRHEFTQGRMFTAKRGLKFFGRVHEQIGTEDGGIYDARPWRSLVRIRLHHAGYEPAVIQAKGKIERNRRLLLLAVEDEPENPGWWYFLGRESLAAGLPEEALDALRRAETLGEKQPNFSLMIEVYKLIMHACGKLGDADGSARAYERLLRIAPGHPDVLMMQAAREQETALALLKEARTHLAAARDGFRTYRGAPAADRLIVEWRADVAAADIELGSGRLAEARELFARARRRGRQPPESEAARGEAHAAAEAAKLLQAEEDADGGEADGSSLGKRHP